MNWNLIVSKCSQPMLWLGLLGVLKFFLQAINITIPDAQINNVANGMAAIVAIVGVIMDHNKQQ